MTQCFSSALAKTLQLFVHLNYFTPITARNTEHFLVSSCFKEEFKPLSILILVVFYILFNATNSCSSHKFLSPVVLSLLPVVLSLSDFRTILPNTIHKLQNGITFIEKTTPFYACNYNYIYILKFVQSLQKPFQHQPAITL